MIRIDAILPLANLKFFEDGLCPGWEDVTETLDDGDKDLIKIFKLKAEVIEGASDNDVAEALFLSARDNYDFKGFVVRLAVPVAELLEGGGYSHNGFGHTHIVWRYVKELTASTLDELATEGHAFMAKHAKK